MEGSAGLFTIHISAFEAASATVSAVAYLVVGLAALMRTPDDIRTRTFAAASVLTTPIYVIPAALFLQARGATHVAPERGALLAMAATSAVGAVALFHFMQVFPWRRPWLRQHRAVIPMLYVIALAGTSAFVVAIPSHVEDLTIPYLVLLTALAVPLLVLLGIVLPVAGLVALYAGLREAARSNVHSARVPTRGIFIGQIAGGVLGILLAPLLRLRGVSDSLSVVVQALVFAFGLLTPIAFAAGVWKYDVLAIDVERGPDTSKR
jgi:hypothetical protein